jgi:hypothetical protein
MGLWFNWAMYEMAVRLGKVQRKGVSTTTADNLDMKNDNGLNEGPLDLEELMDEFFDKFDERADDVDAFVDIEFVPDAKPATKGFSVSDENLQDFDEFLCDYWQDAPGDVKPFVMEIIVEYRKMRGEVYKPYE